MEEATKSNLPLGAPIRKYLALTEVPACETSQVCLFVRACNHLVFTSSCLIQILNYLQLIRLIQKSE